MKRPRQRNVKRRSVSRPLFLILTRESPEIFWTNSRHRLRRCARLSFPTNPNPSPAAPGRQPPASITNQRSAKSPADRERVSSVPPGDVEQVMGKKKDFEEFLGCSLTGDIFKCLVEQQFSLEVQEKIQNLIKTTMDRGIASSKAWGHNEHGENILIRKLETGEEIADSSSVSLSRYR